MAKRKIVTQGEDILYKICKPVENFDEKLALLLDDMKETLIDANGAGLAAPQVGVMRRIAVIDFGEGIIELINPRIIKSSGKERDIEGCLSCPNVWGYVTRPAKCKVAAQDRHGEFFEISVAGLGARAACHEIDHLDGKLFVDLIEEIVNPDDLEKKN